MALIQSDHARLEANRWLVWGRLWYLMGKYHWCGGVNAFSFAQTVLDIGLITVAALMAEEPLIFFFMLIPIVFSSLLWESRAPGITALAALTPALVYVSYTETIVSYTRSWGLFFDVSLRIPVLTFAAV